MMDERRAMLQRWVTAPQWLISLSAISMLRGSSAIGMSSFSWMPTGMSWNASVSGILISFASLRGRVPTDADNKAISQAYKQSWLISRHEPVPPSRVPGRTIKHSSVLQMSSSSVSPTGKQVSIIGQALCRIMASST